MFVFIYFFRCVVAAPFYYFRYIVCARFGMEPLKSTWECTKETTHIRSGIHKKIDIFLHGELIHKFPSNARWVVSGFLQKCLGRAGLGCSLCGANSSTKHAIRSVDALGAYLLCMDIRQIAHVSLDSQYFCTRHTAGPLDTNYVVNLQNKWENEKCTWIWIVLLIRLRWAKY